MRAAILVALLFILSIPIRAGVMVAPSSVNLGNQVVGTASAPVTVTLTNTGGGKVTITDVSVSLAEFSYSGPSLPITLRLGQSLTGTVTFSPTAVQAYSGTLTFTRSTGSKSTATLSGTGVQPVSLTPSIATQPANQTVTAGQTATFSVAASGTAPLSYQWRKSGAAITGATSSSYTTPVTSAADSGATFAVVVNNAAGGVTSNAATLTVNAPTTQLVANPTSLSFGNVNVGSSSTLTVGLTNSGNSNVTISNVSISGPGFNVSGVSNGQILAPGQIATLNVTFAPVATGSVTGSVTITSNATNSPTTISLSGTGIQQSGSLLSPQAPPNDSRFGTDLTCSDSTHCSSPTIHIVAGDIGKNIEIAGAGPVVNDCCSVTGVTWNTFYKGTIQAGSSGSAVILSPALTFDPVAPGAMWMLWPTTDDTATWHAAISANAGGNITVGCSTWPTAPCYYTFATPGVLFGMPSNPPSITCQTGAILLYPIRDDFENVMFVYDGTTGASSITNCVFQGINAAGFAYGHGVDTPVHQSTGSGYAEPVLLFAEFADSGHLTFTKNSCFNMLGDDCIASDGGPSFSSTNDVITYNYGADNPGYLITTQCSTNELVQHNFSIDGSIGPEIDGGEVCNASNNDFGFNYLLYQHNRIIDTFSHIGQFNSPVTSGGPGGGSSLHDSVVDAAGHTAGSNAFAYFERQSPNVGSYFNNVAQNGANCRDDTGMSVGCGIISSAYVPPPTLCSVNNVAGCVGSTTPRPSSGP